MTGKELVSVVVPAYNAKSTIGQTLTSIRGQSYRNLEILVVDDGSTDGTSRTVLAHAAQDQRVRLLRKANGGLSSARNAGIEAASADFIAPIDADDLWHSTKIARQMETIRQADDVGFVYTFYHQIDENGAKIPKHAPDLICEGRAFLRSILYNFVGNGSSLLLRRAAIEGIGCYELRLNACEDFLAQILIARDWQVKCVPEYLTAYRRTPTSMSRDSGRMARAKLAALEYVAHRLPETPRDVLKAAEAVARMKLAACHLHSRRPRRMATELARAFWLDPAIASSEVTMAGRRALSKKLWPQRQASAAAGSWTMTLIQRRMAALASREAAYS